MLPTQHHHRHTTKVTNKPYKSRHATKNALRDISKGKVEIGDKTSRKTRHQQIMSKFDRKNQAKQKRQNERHALHEQTTIFSPKIGAPRIVAVVPLHPTASAAAAIARINESCKIHEEIPAVGSICIKIPAHRTSVRYMALPPKDLFATLDACRVADFVIFVLSAQEMLDDFGDLVLTAAKAQGISHFMMATQGSLVMDSQNRKPAATETVQMFMKQRFPEQDRLRCLDVSRDCATIMQWICSKSPKGVSWRDNRSWMFIEGLEWSEVGIAHNETDSSAEVKVTGTVRGRNLSSNRLVHLGDWGDYQIDRITAAPIEKVGREKDSMEIDSSQGKILDNPTNDQEDLAELAPEEITMEEAETQVYSIAPSERKGVLLDDHHYFDEDKEDGPEVPRRLPRGTSEYQSAWYLGDISDSGSDMEDVDDIAGGVSIDGSTHPAEGRDGPVDYDQPMTEAGPSEYPQSEVFLDPSPDEEEEQIAAYRAQRRKEAEDNLDFPDEIELHPNVLARERLARYRGLKSLRTSHWETEEDRFYEPEEWPRLLEIGNYKAAKNRFIKEALVNGVKPGTRVHVYLRNVPVTLQNSEASPPVSLFSLLRHERKHAAVNYNITLNSAYPTELKSKDELILQCGPRRCIINPLFSQAGDTPNDVHKFERFLHSGRSAIASFVGPLTWGPTPALFFKRMALPPSVNDGTDNGVTHSTASSFSPSDGIALVATGTSLAPSTSRVIAKRIILTGHPYKIHKKLVTVRYMFFNPDDVQWFKALQLWTKRGRVGHIKESLGTHGYFKATFDAKVNPMDAVAISLYKRVWPRRARLFTQ
ncbi:DUF663-domain-containing protein [Viridothelium virens]|uniref:DUF663-domain-containing protein n=1 Tax=Viridothelium virens TaxID=1048519 RepID=A0A6A6HGR8_VIRVR|nr:DUF663-domain-containing protein [Viridothelium virens]